MSLTIYRTARDICAKERRHSLEFGFCSSCFEEAMRRPESLLSVARVIGALTSRLDAVENQLRNLDSYLREQAPPGCLPIDKYEETQMTAMRVIGALKLRSRP